MNFDNMLEVFMNLHEQLLAAIHTSTAIVDYQSLGICCIVFCLSAIVLYIIVLYGTRGLTYEEAIEQQRKRNREASELAKNEKNKKDKKFKKWNKKNREKDDDKISLCDIQHENDSADMSSSLDIKVSQKKKHSKRLFFPEESLQQPSSSDVTDEQSSHSSPCHEPKKATDQSIIEFSVLKDEKSKFDILDEERLDNEKENVNDCEETSISSSITEQNILSQTKSPKKKKRKQKSDSGIANALSPDLNATKILTFLKSATFCDEELGLLSDVINSKQSGIGGWTKKNDPIPGLRKQILEKDEALLAEQRLRVSTCDQLKSLKQELTKEKSRSFNTERSLRDKISQQQKEILKFPLRLKLQHEQHRNEIQANIKQVTTKLNEEHSLIVQQLEDENNKLRLTEPEKHAITLYQMENDELRLQLHNLEKHIENVVSNREKEEFDIKQKMNDLSNKLQLSEKSCSSLMCELQAAQSACSNLEAEKTSLIKVVEDAKQRLTATEQERFNNARFTVVKTQQSAYEELEKQVQEKDFVIQRLLCQIKDPSHQENLRLIKEYNLKVESLTKEIEEQREKNSVLEENLKKIQHEMQTTHAEYEKKIQEAEENANGKIKTIEEHCSYQISEAIADIQAKRLLAKEANTMELQKFCNKCKGFLEKLYPDIKIQEESDDTAKILLLLKEAVHLKKQEVSLVPVLPIASVEECSRMTKLLCERSMLTSEVQKYTEMLADAEDVLLKVQNRLETEEKSWKETLLVKDEDLKNVKAEKERLIVEKKLLEARIENLINLTQKDVLEAKLLKIFEGAAAAEEELENLDVKCSNECTAAVSTECDDTLMPIVEDYSNCSTLKSEKRKKNKKKATLVKK